VYTDANIVMGAESADFFFACWYLKVTLRMAEFDTYQGSSTISRKTLDYPMAVPCDTELYQLR
jgi:hypothetical protein